MLIRFSFRNYRSIGPEKVNLEMVSSSKLRNHQDHVVQLPFGGKVLKNAVIYGGNASGKSNTLQALELMKAAVLLGAIPQQASAQYCRVGTGMSKEESVFDVQFHYGGLAFDYGFSCYLETGAVTSEWLYELGRKSERLFERDANDITMGDGFVSSLRDFDVTRLEVYRNDFVLAARSKPSALFLSALGVGKSYEEGSALSKMALACSWFADGLDILLNGGQSQRGEFYSDTSTLDAVAKVLASFDTGISALRKEEVSIDELDRYVPADQLMALRNVFSSVAAKGERGPVALTLRSDEAFVSIEGLPGGKQVATILKIGHRGSALEFNYSEESEGTKRLLGLMDLLFTGRKDTAFVVDELSRSFHPLLTKQFVELFNKRHADDGCQLIFTTHENDIMSYDYFRRDEIWFVERDEDGYSRLYPLDSFAQSGDARTDARIGKRYLEGRYGGVPVLSMPMALDSLDLVGGE